MKEMRKFHQTGWQEIPFEDITTVSTRKPADASFYSSFYRAFFNKYRDIRELDLPRECIVCVNSGTAALHLAIQAIKGVSDEILVQSLTYMASFQAISAGGAVLLPAKFCLKL